MAMNCSSCAAEEGETSRRGANLLREALGAMVKIEKVHGSDGED
jgi:hypothetical protein